MKDTNNLRQELMEAPSLDQFLSENQLQPGQHLRITEPAFSEAKDFQSDACQAIRYERSIFASGFFRAAQSLPQPSSVPVLWPERVAGGNPGAFEAMRVCPALSQGQTGCHYPLRYFEWNGSICSKRQAVCGK